MADRINLRTEEPAQDPGVAPEGTTETPVGVNIRDDQTPTNQANEEAPSDDSRPQWLPEKFETPEAMAEAYSALEKKLGSGEKDKEEPAEPSAPASLDLASLVSEYEENQGLTDETYAKLEAAGLGRDVVDEVIASRTAGQDALTRAVFAEAGSQESYEEMIAWARTGYRSEQAQAFDAALEAGPEAARMAVRALKADFIEANGRAPSLQTTAPRGEASTGVKAFKSQHQVYEAMRDPRYRTDPHYREEVARRIAASNLHTVSYAR